MFISDGVSFSPVAYAENWAAERKRGLCPSLLGGCWPSAPKDKGSRGDSRVWIAMRMMEELWKTTAARQVYFIFPGIGYIRAFLGVQVERANWSQHQTGSKGDFCAELLCSLTESLYKVSFSDKTSYLCSDTLTSQSGKDREAPQRQGVLHLSGHGELQP